MKKIMLVMALLVTVITTPIMAQAHDGGHGNRGGWGGPGPVLLGTALGLGAGVAIGEAISPPAYYAAPTYYAPPVYAPAYAYPVQPCRQYTQPVMQPNGYYSYYVTETCQAADGNWYVVAR